MHRIQRLGGLGGFGGHGRIEASAPRSRAGHRGFDIDPPPWVAAA